MPLDERGPTGDAEDEGGATVVIEILGPAREALQRRLDTPNTKTHLFHHPNLHRPFAGARTVREAYWQPAVEEAGVRQRTMYTTRHTFATRRP